MREESEQGGSAGEILTAQAVRAHETPTAGTKTVCTEFGTTLCTLPTTRAKPTSCTCERPRNHVTANKRAAAGKSAREEPQQDLAKHAQLTKLKELSERRPLKVPLGR